jgi:hypothetical protein
MKVERRRLSFERLEDAVAEAEALLAVGYHRAGNWDLTQCCDHLSVLMQYPLDSFPTFPLPMRLATWVLRHTIAPRMLKRILDTERWPEGVPTDNASVPIESGRDIEGVERLRRAVDRLLTHSGPLRPSPLLGLLDKETLVRLHRIHAAHHLGFLVPRSTYDDAG